VSERFPVCSAKDVIRVLRKNGFSQLSQKGSHQKWRHPNGRQVIVAIHGNKPISTQTETPQDQAKEAAADQKKN
jgi:predicted RNA binding protein YcfA (HicA-like mRNA interferase family)